MAVSHFLVFHTLLRRRAWSWLVLGSWTSVSCFVRWSNSIHITELFSSLTKHIFPASGPLILLFPQSKHEWFSFFRLQCQGPCLPITWNRWAPPTSVGSIIICILPSIFTVWTHRNLTRPQSPLQWFSTGVLRPLWGLSDPFTEVT